MEDKIEAIRARYEADPYDRSQAVADRATLLRLLDAALEEIATWHSVFPDIAPDRVLPDRSRMEGAMLVLAEELDAAQAELAKISAWTDDDQRGLNAAVADAMWHWDDMPMDCDDATVLTSVLKSSLQDNGFQIVRLATSLATDATT
jgi:hypothetical protein